MIWTTRFSMKKLTLIFWLAASFLSVQPALADERPVAPGSIAALKNGIASAPSEAPDVVKKAVWAANQIAGMPYKYGGGHGEFSDTGYDCSGAVSYVLGSLELIGSPMDSKQYLDWGEAGPGKWLTVYARDGHVFLVIAGLRFDTTDRLNIGPGWREHERAPDGFVARHPKGY